MVDENKAAMTIEPQTIAELKALYEKARLGPLEADDLRIMGRPDGDVDGDGRWVMSWPHIATVEDFSNSEDIVDLFVAAINALPALLTAASEAERLRAELKVANALLRYTEATLPAPAQAEHVAWQDISTRPRDDTVLVAVEPTEQNVAFGKNPRKTHPAYIDEHGRICDATTWKPDAGLSGGMWRSVAWRHMPTPPPPAGEG